MFQALTLARYTLIEAFRNRLGMLSVVLVLLALGFSMLLKQIAITETAQVQAALLASSLRLVAVLVLAAFVVTSHAREAADKGLELLLSHALPRAKYVIGKLLGYCAGALLLALLFTLPLFFFAPATSGFAWGTSLFLELCIVAATSLFCALTFSHFVFSLTIVIGFYALARSIAVFQLMGSVQLLADPGWPGKVANALIDAIAFLLPRLDGFTQTAWLVYPSEASMPLIWIAIQSVIYTFFLSAAALFDFYRKNL